MKTKFNYWRWISLIISIAAIVYLNNLGVNIWIAPIIIAIVTISKFLDGIWRGRNEYNNIK